MMAWCVCVGGECVSLVLVMLVVVTSLPSSSS